MSRVRIPLPALFEMPRGHVFMALSATEETQPHVLAERCRKSMGIIGHGISLGLGSRALR
jgi:hypothetical protein